MIEDFENDMESWKDRVKCVLVQTPTQGEFAIYFVDGDPRVIYQSSQKDGMLGTIRVWSSRGDLPLTPHLRNVLWQARDKFTKHEFV